MAYIHPPALKSGDRIGVIAPSSAWDKSLCAQTFDSLKVRGYDVVCHPQIDKKNNQFAGTSAEKLAALHEYFADDSINAIFCLVGGNGALHLLDKIDYGLIKRNPKIIMGFSDVTALLNAITAQTGLITYHGPTITRMDQIAASDLEQCFDILSGKPQSIPCGDISAEGTLWGGNLSVLQALIGTDYAPKINQPNILFIEDVNDHLSRYDRMLAHMALAGWFKNTKAILVGQFLKSQDNPERPFGMDIKDILSLHAPDIPVLSDLPISHGERLITLPIGAHALLKNGALSFKS